MVGVSVFGTRRQRFVDSVVFEYEQSRGVKFKSVAYFSRRKSQNERTLSKSNFSFCIPGSLS
jgi:hypothetical protein